ncbi:basic proline-rich protein-like [Penaeus monodon]|uniref:basic proline-rich protein-like n=1 Tax=Penaeus monodon TaxID=6687 RepID=UPI0018A712A4|nr:basic proline-rich protein-like [Penaeus monodon]
MVVVAAASPRDSRSRSARPGSRPPSSRRGPGPALPHKVVGAAVQAARPQTGPPAPPVPPGGRAFRGKTCRTWLPSPGGLSGRRCTIGPDPPFLSYWAGLLSRRGDVLTVG